MKILVTAGATREPIDAVRFLSNTSTGSSGAKLADTLAARGHTIALLRGEGAAAPNVVSDTETFSTTENLRACLQRRLAGGDFDAVVMAAAVADYHPEAAVAGKIVSDAESLTLRLVRNRKILPKLKSLSPRPILVVGFKLTVGADAAARRAAVADQFAKGGVDLVVHNDVENTRRAPEHPFWIYRDPDETPVRVEGPEALAVALDEHLAEIGRSFRKATSE